MDKKQSLTISIALTLITLLAFQLLLFQAFTASFQVSSPLRRPYHIGVIIYHFLLFIILYINRPYFRYVNREEPLTHINATNKLTMIRLSSMPTAGALIYLSSSYERLLPLLTLFMIAIFLTDAADGFISRKTNQITEIGKMLDSSSDYLLLFVIALVFLIKGIISPFFFGLVIIRFMVQIMGMIRLWIMRGSPLAVATLWGKILIFTLMSLFALELIAMLPLPLEIPAPLLEGLEYFTMSIMVISLADKILFLFRNSKTIREEQKKKGD